MLCLRTVRAKPRLTLVLGFGEPVKAALTSGRIAAIAARRPLAAFEHGRAAHRDLLAIDGALALPALTTLYSLRH